MSFGNRHTCQIEEISTIRIKLFDEMIREMKDVRYVTQLQKNLISVGTLKMQGLRGTLGEGVLKISSSLLAVMKSVRRNNLYYLKGSAVTENLSPSEHLKDDSTRLWQMRFRYTGEKSLQSLVKQGSVEGACTCNLELGGHNILDKMMKWNSTPQLTAQKVFLIVFTLVFRVRVLPRLLHLEAISTLSRLLMIYLGDVRYTL